jgi:nickel-dependent lactate racemase
MRIGIDYGREHIDFDAAESTLVGVHRSPPAPPLPDPGAAVRQALEHPHNWPALRRALTPDDHVAIVVDEQLPQLSRLVAPLLEHLVEAHVAPEAVTLLCAPPGSSQAWIDELPDEFADVHVEVHDPHDRRKLSYLATTRHGRRLYLNRTAVDADQLIVLSGRRYDPILGYAGAETALYPALADDATRAAVYGRPTLDVPGAVPWPIRQEAAEVAWLLGAPFLIQVIEGAGDGIAHILGGSLDSSAEGQRLLDECWRITVDQRADVVLAGISGDPVQHDLATLAQALASAARVVQAGGQIVLLTQAMPELGTTGEMLQSADTPRELLDKLKQDRTPGSVAAFQWATAAEQAHVYLLSGLAGDVAEELFTTPLERAGQAQRLLVREHTCLLLPDAHKTMAVLKE